MRKGKNKKMIIGVYILVATLGIILIVLIIGLLLPSERTESRQTEFKADPKTVYNVITNNQDFSYRSDLKDLIIVEKEGDIELWDEVAKNGNTIRFRTAKKEPYTRYEFEIVEAGGFTGYWIGELKETTDGGTLFTATEIIRIKNPFMKALSYLFFDVGKFMETYQEDLRKKLNEK